PERVRGEAVSAAYFNVLGVNPARGRFFTPEEDNKPDAAMVAVVSESFWNRRLGSGALGASIRLDNRAYSVIGVAPRYFRGMGDDADVWIPSMASGLGDAIRERGSRWLPAVARLRQGQTREQAQAEMDTICRQLEQAHP